MGTRVNPWLPSPASPPLLPDDDTLLLASGVGSAVGVTATAGDVVGRDEGFRVGAEVGTEVAGAAVGDTVFHSHVCPVAAQSPPSEQWWVSTQLQRWKGAAASRSQIPYSTSQPCEPSAQACRVGDRDGGLVGGNVGGGGAGGVGGRVGGNVGRKQMSGRMTGSV